MLRYENLNISKTTLRIVIINIPLDSLYNQLFFCAKQYSLDATYHNLCAVEFSKQEKRCAGRITLVTTISKTNNRVIPDMTETTKDRGWAKSEKLFNKLKHPKATNMVWFFSNVKNSSRIWTRGMSCLSQIFKTDLRLNTDVYLDIYSTVVFP